MCELCFEKSRVTNPRRIKTKNGKIKVITRRRICRECGKRWTTYEINRHLFNMLIDEFVEETE